MFDGRETDVTCPKCGHKNRKTLGWLRDQLQLACGGCGVEMTIDSKKMRAGLDAADKALDDFLLAMRDLGHKG